MMVQYSKFIKISRETSWRGDIASINYIETSTWTRQEHNGFSHQNPSFIGAVLNLKPTAARVYFPPDVNTFLSTVAHCFQSKNYVNLMVGSKQPSAVLLSTDEAESHCRAGGSIWRWASTDSGLDPDEVLVGIGAELTFEVIAAASLLCTKCPKLRVSVVNVTDLMILGAYDDNDSSSGSTNRHFHAVSDEHFDALSTECQPIHFNSHGYDNELKGLLFGRPNMDRVTISSYMEEGSTPTPFNMMLLNRTLRFYVAIQAVNAGSRRNEKVKLRLHELVSELQGEMKDVTDFILKEKTGMCFNTAVTLLVIAAL